MKTIAIVINYRQEEATRVFVQNQLSKIKSLAEIIVVDNGSTVEGLQKLKRDIAGEHCHILESKENLGFARANNLAAEYAKEHFDLQKSSDETYFLFANNDINLLNEDAADVLIKKLREHPEVGIIGPKVMGLDGKLQSPEPYISFWDRHIWVYWSNLFYSKAKKRKRFKEDYAEQAKEGYHYRVMGSFFVTPVKAFFDCGMMDPGTFLFAEEAILGERMLKIGLKTYYYPGVTVIHEHGKSMKGYFSRNRIREWKFKSDCYYYRKYKGTSSFLILIARFTYWLKKLFRR